MKKIVIRNNNNRKIKETEELNFTKRKTLSFFKYAYL